jgi:hydrogenase maturation protease
LNTVVIGIGNPYRRDDGVGPAVAAAISERALPGVRVLNGIEDPMRLLDAWSGTALALLIDAATAARSTPGRIRRVTAGDVASASGVSSHSLNIAQAFALGQALGRVPNQLVVFTVEAADIGHGVGLTPKVAAAVPDVVGAAVAEIVSRSAEQPDGK